jgi:hypothetical protein
MTLVSTCACATGKNSSTHRAMSSRTLRHLPHRARFTQHSVSLKGRSSWNGDGLHLRHCREIAFRRRTRVGVSRSTSRRSLYPAGPMKDPLLRVFHGASRTRTGDLLGAIQALSQLSYSPARTKCSEGYEEGCWAPCLSKSLPAVIVSAMSFDSSR